LVDIINKTVELKQDKIVDVEIPLGRLTEAVVSGNLFQI
jgi:hypothetical protein